MKSEENALVPIHEVEAELIFEPVTSTAGPRKLCRASIVSQLSEHYLSMNHTSHMHIKWKEAPNTQRAHTNRKILRLIRDRGIISRYCIVKETGISYPNVIHTLDELV
ncbi:MAG TPA: hypothetical protein VGL27_17360 [Negativicutes bacterium]|jgi:hypothetical protein